MFLVADGESAVASVDGVGRRTAASLRPVATAMLRRRVDIAPDILGATRTCPIHYAFRDAPVADSLSHTLENIVNGSTVGAAAAIVREFIPKDAALDRRHSRRIKQPKVPVVLRRGADAAGPQYVVTDGGLARGAVHAPGVAIAGLDDLLAALVHGLDGWYVRREERGLHVGDEEHPHATVADEGVARFAMQPHHGRHRAVRGRGPRVPIFGDVIVIFLLVLLVDGGLHHVSKRRCVGGRGGAQDVRVVGVQPTKDSTPIRFLQGK